MCVGYTNDKKANPGIVHMILPQHLPFRKFQATCNTLKCDSTALPHESS